MTNTSAEGEPPSTIKRSFGLSAELDTDLLSTRHFEEMTTGSARHLKLV
jgi:hypothetical protein